MVPIAVLAAVAREPIVEILFGHGDRARGPRAHRRDACRVPRRADGARADRRARPRVLRPAGHGHAGRRRGRGGRHQLRPWRSSWSVRSGCPASRWRSPSRPGSRRSPSWRSCAAGCRPLRARAGSRRVGARIGRRQRGRRGHRIRRRARRLDGALGADPPAGSGWLADADARRGVAFAAVYRRACRSPCGSRTAVYRRGHGRRAPPPASRS